MIYSLPASGIVGGVCARTDIEHGEHKASANAVVHVNRLSVLGVSDWDWQYLNVRRSFIFLEPSIECGTKWGVFKPRGDRPWVDRGATGLSNSCP
jgi:phage tail sheath protein FI